MFIDIKCIVCPKPAKMGEEDAVKKSAKIPADNEVSERRLQEILKLWK